MGRRRGQSFFRSHAHLASHYRRCIDKSLRREHSLMLVNRRAGGGVTSDSRTGFHHGDSAMHAPRRFTLPGVLLALVAANRAWAAGPLSRIRRHRKVQRTQSPGARCRTPQRQITRLSRKLQLTPDQAAKIEPILQNRQQQMQQLLSDTSLTPRDLHQKIRALRQGSDAKTAERKARRIAVNASRRWQRRHVIATDLQRW